MGLNSDPFLSELTQNDEQRQLDALFRISGFDRDFVPNNELVSRVLVLLRTGSFDIVERAIFLLGLRWKIESSLELILAVLRNHSAPVSLRRLAATAAASLAERFNSRISEATKALSEQTYDPKNPVDVKAGALLEMKRLERKVDAKKYARLSVLQGDECMRILQSDQNP